ncbi:SusC/RagA family TonB-linked outer membrane protein [Mucilaginibacter lappiensis]|uniref:TonB-linked SusC/RagA family outer membrane protein n=1 Tax=Mucilaginibacter lappiensis TaxID=354630 RepID=A0A1N7F050_9SPHI|nr:SusC/RagA family TonB-linked outer membrane protein [Mucilaginibacter lappiensis]MBB6112148.1 TonB-linked SusC/RagA family outer membrane protein [Mucilaginibacter lappiensis]MBB6131289.1 TonB-linked SusC/RagA family outer membrane protein [Mucilaginibacter lappiensis]SIR93716.1 TonB-linked outer membrane protein, SusC/RagA family [Mucilaginibacter lappiensis]
MMNIYKKILICCMLLFYYGLAYAQVNITGTVKGADDGRPIPGVSVTVKGEKRGLVTDSEGKFKISVTPNTILRFSFIGFDAKEVDVKEKTVINVSLQPSKNELNNVVVVGYHEIKQRTTTAAITVISGKDIENLPAPSFDIALQGKVTGVNIQNFSGQPGVRNTFTVRGNSALSSNLSEANALSTPLFIIDGVPTSLTDLGNYDNTQTDVLAGININDIESIQIAKDAAATAIWGSRGANGVITIKTKRAVKGKPQINLNVYGGFSDQPKLTETATGSYERNQKLNFLTQQGGVRAIGSLPQMLTDSLNPAFNNATNWQGLFYRKGYIHNVDLSIAGATDAINYRFSLNNYDENGVLYGTGFKRYSFRSNIDYQINDKLSTEVNISFSRVDRQPGLGNDPHEVNPLSGFQQPSSLYYTNDTDIARYRGQYDQLRNLDRNDLLTGFIGLHYKILPGLLYKIEGSGSTNMSENQFSSPTTLSAQGIATSYDYSSNYVSANVNNVLSYGRKIGTNHNINILVLQNFQRDVVNSKNIYGDNVPDDNIKVVQGVPQSSLKASTDYQASSLLSYATQVHYDFKEKYLFDATMRADASSRFGSNHKWGYFPSVSAGYILSDENYLKPVRWISLLKVRASYGVNGDQPSDFYAPYNGYNLTQGYYNGVAMGTPNFNTGNGVTDKNLTWEPTKQFDIGFDGAFFNSRINLTIDYYNKIQSNKYYTFPLAFYTGYTQQTSNSGLSVGNSGIEVNIDTHNLPPSSKFQWTTNFNFSYNKNQILSLPNGNRTIYATYNDNNSGLGINYIFQVGKPLYMLNQMIYQGVYNSQSQIPVNPFTGQALTYFKGNYPVKPGYPIWKDSNGDYDVWSDEDKGNAQGDLLPTANPNPAITGGFNNNFSYKNFSLGIGMTFTLKRDIINSLLSNQYNNWASGITNFTSSSIPDLSKIGFWDPVLAAKDPAGYKAKYPALNPGGAYFYQFFPFSTMFNENGAYLKITNISLGYKLSKRYLDALGLSGCRFYAVLQNVYTFQKAKVPDAEQVNPFGIYDGATYPIPKKVTLGVSVQF